MALHRDERGLKSGKPVEPTQVDGRIAQLRAQAKNDRDKANTEGGARAGEPANDNSHVAGQVEPSQAGTLPPADYTELQLTEMEAPLQEALRGADTAWLKDAHAACPTVQAALIVELPEAVRRAEKLAEMRAEMLAKSAALREAKPIVRPPALERPRRARAPRV